MSFEMCFQDEKGPQISTQIQECMINDESPQTATTVVAVILESLEKFHQAYPHVKMVYLKFDNAG